MEGKNETTNMIVNRLDRLQRPPRSRTMDEATTSRNELARTGYTVKIRKGERFSLDGDNDYDVNIPTLVNTLNKLVNRMDTINHRLEAGNIGFCHHACYHERHRGKCDSACSTDILECADDNEPSTLKPTNYGKHETQEQVMHSVLMQDRMQTTLQDGKYHGKPLQPYPLPQIQNKSANVSEHKSHATTIGILAEETFSNGQNHLHHVPKKMDNKQVRNKTDEQGKPVSSAAVIHTDSSGLKSTQTDPTKDNRRKYIKEGVQLITGKNMNVKPKQQTKSNRNFNHSFNLKKNEGALVQEHLKSVYHQTKEMKSSPNMRPTKGHEDAECNVVKTENSVDPDSEKQDGVTISGPITSHTSQTPKIPNETVMPSSHVPQEYWNSLVQETHEKAQIIKASRSIGLNTIICLDTSMSMDEYWGDILEFFRNLINEIDVIQPMEGGLMEHIAVMTFGHETCVLQHFSTDYKEILTKIHMINPEGSTPMYWILHLCEAILSETYVPLLRGFRIDARLLMITDGRPTNRFITGGQDVPLRSDEEQMEKDDTARTLIKLHSSFPFLRVYPVTVGNKCDMEFLSAMADSTGGKVMTLSDWPVMAQFGKKMELTSKYFGLASLPGNLLANVLTEKSGLPQEEIEFITCAIEEQIKVQNDEGYTSDEEKIKGFYQFPPVGSRVRRGPDWNRKDEDNNGPGTLYGYAKGKAFSGWVMVQWDKPKKYGRWRFRYRYGAENAHDIEIQANENPMIMDSFWGVRTGCEVIRGRYRNSTDKDADDVDEGSIGMVYETLDIGGAIEVKVRWHNGKRGKYRNSALELELSPRSRPNHFSWPFAPLPPYFNPLMAARQPNLDVSGQDLPRQVDLPPSWGQSTSKEMQNSDVADEENWDDQSSSRDVTGEREALTIEHVERYRMPSVDDMNSRNEILTRRKGSMNKQTFGKTVNTHSNAILESREEVKSDKATQQAESYGNPKRQRPKRRNKNADV